MKIKLLYFIIREILNWIKGNIRLYNLRNKYPENIFNKGVSVCDKSELSKFIVLFSDVSLFDCKIGKYTYIQTNSALCNVEVGNFCSIANNVSIGLANHPLDMVSTSPVFYDNTQPLPKFFANTKLFNFTLPRTIIQSDVWIGQGVIVKAGLKIGVGSIIGAGSVVTKDIPPYSIAVGNPCRIIKFRFSEEIIKGLISTNWWDYEDAKLHQLTKYFISPEKFLVILEKNDFSI